MSIVAPANPPAGKPAIFVAQGWTPSPVVIGNNGPTSWVMMPIGTAVRFPMTYNAATGRWAGQYQIHYPYYYQPLILFGR